MNLKQLGLISSLLAVSPSTLSAQEVNNLLDNTATGITSICRENSTQADREQKKYFMDMSRRLYKKIQEYNWENKNIRIYEEAWFYDIFIELDTPINIEWREYSEVYMNISPDYTYTQTKFKNSETFPMIRFIHDHAYKNPTEICQEQRYYDDIDNMNLDWSSLWESVLYNHELFQQLIHLLDKNLK